MKHYLLLVCMLLATAGYAQTAPSPTDTVPKTPFDENAGTDTTDQDTLTPLETKSDILGALLSYNFSGNKKGLSNLTPVINYGWTRTITSSESKHFFYDLSINPYVGGQIDVRDSTSYVPGLMLPGTVGISVNNFLRFKLGQKGELVWSPLNFGYKLISNFADSTLTVAQHNLRSALILSYDDLFIFGIQYTYGWHNSTSESEKTFKSVFKKGSTDMQYLLISLQTKLSDKFSKTPMYLFAEWRGVLNQKAYSNFDNLRIVTFGFRADMNLNNAAPAKKAKRPQ